MPIEDAIKAVNSIVGAFLQAQRLRQEREEAFARQAFDWEQLRQRNEQFQDTLKLQQARLDSTEALNQSLIKARRAQLREWVVKAAAAGNIMGRVNPEDPSQALYDLSELGLPEEGTMTFPSEFARRAMSLERGQTAADVAEMKAEALQPLKESLIRLGQEGAMQRLKEGFLHRQMLQQSGAGIASELEEQRQKNRIELKKTAPGKAGETPGEAGEEIDPAQWATDLYRGAKTTEHLRNIPIAKRKEILASVQKMGGLELTPDEAKNVGALAAVNYLRESAAVMAGIIQKKGYGAKFDTTYLAKEAAFETFLGTMRGAVKGESGPFTEGDATRMRGAKPSLTDGPFNTLSAAASAKKVLEIDKFLNEKTKQILGKYDLRQQRALQKTFNLRVDPRTDPKNFAK